jgi:hypothetical protein
MLAMKKFWSAFKSVSKHSNIPNKMTWSQPDGGMTSANNPSDIANILNQYSYSVFKYSDGNDDEMSFPNCNDPNSDTSVRIEVCNNVHRIGLDVYNPTIG